jgi:hypothetical protein
MVRFCIGTAVLSSKVPSRAQASRSSGHFDMENDQHKQKKFALKDRMPNVRHRRNGKIQITDNEPYF